MNKPTIDELADYVFGDLSEERVRELTSLAEEDAETASRINLMRLFGGVSHITTGGETETLPSHQRAAMGASQPGKDAQQDESFSALQPDSEALRSVAKAFQERAAIEGNGIEAISKCPVIIQAEAIKELESCVVGMQRASGEHFLLLDEKFHLCLARRGGVTGKHRDFIQVIFKYSYLVIRTEETRRAVCDEHQSIVAALKERDFSRASELHTAHLRHAYERWFPHYVALIASRNRPYFDRMSMGAFLIFISSNIDPLEMASQHLNSVGKALAAAVGRGATLLYLRPSRALLQHWQEKGITGMLGDESHMQTDFEAFQGQIISKLSEWDGAVKGSERISEDVRQRVIQLYLDDESLFLLTGPNRSLGYFHYCDGQDELTERVPMRDHAAWSIIDPLEKTRLEQKFFLCTLRTLLNRLISERPLPKTVQSLADAVSDLADRLSQGKRTI